MPRATGQLTSEVSSLSELKRSELQALAKVRLNLRMVITSNRLTIEAKRLTVSKPTERAKLLSIASSRTRRS